MREAYNVIIGNPSGKRSLGRLREGNCGWGGEGRWSVTDLRETVASLKLAKVQWWVMGTQEIKLEIQ
jgi:hypothetical protein